MKSGLIGLTAVEANLFAQRDTIRGAVESLDAFGQHRPNLPVLLIVDREQLVVDALEHAEAHERGSTGMERIEFDAQILHCNPQCRSACVLGKDRGRREQAQPAD
ncbi:MULTISPECIES: hypothetical protein [Bradyrhizobium]|uniref:hypothetical protein n=1 Tax=Bradyrhizobium TaxID=374 RepID=UPI0004873203|nr:MULTISPECIES: hypothetical protein [Bradyrhizobium]MBR1292431.1 hypothetical protein [Bradyrhizobium ottawaense]WLB47594.1 hypothetical protein QIH93_06180 [Bradyrhizobium ottawaense]WQN84919.1 hypothetical protein U7859_11080 [Bradyrhizobium ottawaense]